MTSLSLNELKLTAQSRNRSDSKEDLIKALREIKPKPEIRINKKKLEEIRKDFNELRHKFSEKEVGKDRKTFYDIKSHKHLSTSEIKKVSKNLTK